MKAEWSNKDSLSIESTGQKAILVIDMPKGCCECNCAIDLCHGTIPSQEWYNKRPSWCPLRPMPEKHNCGEKTSEAGKIYEAWCWGWDACIDEITGGTE